MNAMELNVQSFDKICRACLTESGDMKSLFTKLEGGQKLLELLEFSTNLSLNSEDGLPRQICGECETFLNKIDAFKKRCRESDTILKNIIQTTCNEYFIDTNAIKNYTETNYSSNKGNYETLAKPDLTSVYTNPEITFKRIELDNIKEKDTVKTEIGIEFEENDFKIRLECEDESFTNTFDNNEEFDIPLDFKLEKDIDNEKYVNNKELIRKNNLKAGSKVKNYVKNKKNYSKKTFIPIRNTLACPKCNLTFDSVKHWNEHQTTHSEQNITVKDEEIPQFQCSLCLRKFKSKKSLRKHIARHQATDNIKHVCVKCKREFKYKAYLESHYLSVHANTSEGYICEHCPEKFLSRKDFEVHSNSHKSKKNMCPFCDKSFLMVCTLKDHLRIHTGEKPFLCSICGKGFSQKTNLGQHMRRHMGVKPFKCEICSMGFVSKGELDSHTRKHTGAHPFKCNDCGNGFTTSSALVKHRRTHTGERPYACDLCPMKFAATGTLKNHRRTHTGERPYQCSHCEKSFVQRSDLISHIRCHTGERPFVCPHCGQAFRKAAAMKCHVKMHARETQNVMALQGGLILNGMQCEGQITTT